MPNIARRHMLQASITSCIASQLAKKAFADTISPGEDALTIMASDSRFTFWVRTLKSSGLAQYASSASQFTAFVPTNLAFSKYPDVLAEVLRSNNGLAFPDTTSQATFVRAHIVLGLHPLSDFAGNISTLMSAAGTPITIDGTKPGTYSVTWVSVDWRAATTQLTDAPIIASNAILYPFDNVTLT